MPKVVLDPGHGQYGNKGVLGYYEGTQMWYLGQYLMAELKSLGWEVKNTRPKITDDPALEWRGQQAKGYDLFISLHSNAPGTSATNYSSIRGVAIYDSVADKLDYLEIPLVAEIAKIMNTPNNGVKHRWNTRADRQGQDYYGVLRNATTVAGCPDAMLIEHGYHTNSEDAKWLLNHDNLKKLAKAEAIMIDRLWRAKNGDDNMVICQRGDKNDNVTAMQTGLMKLGFSMAHYGADSAYGSISSSAVGSFRAKYKVSGSADIWDHLANNRLIIELSKLKSTEGMVPKADYDKKVAEVNSAKKATAVAESRIKTVASDIRKIADFANSN